MDLFTIGRVVKAHGIDGTLKVISLTDFPQHFKTLDVVYLIKREVLKSDVQEVRFHKNFVLLKLKGFENRNEAQEWKGAEVGVDSTSLWPLNEGEYYYFQIVGLKVLTEEGVHLGEIQEIIATGGNDVYVVRNEDIEVLLPAIKDVVKKIDLERKIMIVHILDGLFD